MGGSVPGSAGWRRLRRLLVPLAEWILLRSALDAGKKVKGRKRFLVVDTLGLPVAIQIQAASVQERDGGPLVIAQPRPRSEIPACLDLGR